eukprot:1445480-Alexandrium_andersonii.AAC.1
MPWCMRRCSCDSGVGACLPCVPAPIDVCALQKAGRRSAPPLAEVGGPPPGRGFLSPRIRA